MKKNFFYYFSSSALTGILSLLVIVPISTYYLDPEDFGIIAIIMVFSGITAISSTAYSWILSGNYYKVSSDEKGELTFNVLFLGSLLRAGWALLLGVTGAFFLPLLIKSYEPIFLIYFWIFLAAEWFNYLWQVTAYIIMLEKKGEVNAILEVIKIVSRIVVLTVCLAGLGLKTVSLALAYLGASLGGFLFSAFYIRKYLVLKIRMKWLKEIVRFNILTTPMRVFEIISNSIGKFLIERWTGLAQLGIYSHSLDYQKAFLLPHRAFQKTYAPEALEAISKNKKSEIRIAKEALRKWFGLLVLAGVFVSLFSREVVSVLTHGKFIAAAPLVSLWFILILIYTFGISYNQFLMAHKKNKFLFSSEIVAGVIFWAVIVVFIHLFGAIGATVSVLLYYLSFYLARKIYALKLGCDNFEGGCFFMALAVLLPLIYLANVFSLSLTAKVVISLPAVLLVIKYYGLVSLGALKAKWVNLLVKGG